jgi:hypothetical protein
MDAAPLSKQIETPTNHITLLASTTPHSFEALLPLIHTFVVSSICWSSSDTVLQTARLPFACTAETESRHRENGVPHAVLVDGVYVRPAHRAHLALSQPWALAVPVALFHCTLAESQRTPQGPITRRRREQPYVRAPTPPIRHEWATVWRGALTVC